MELAWEGRRNWWEAEGCGLEREGKMILGEHISDGS